MAKQAISDDLLRDVCGGFFNAEAKAWWDKYEDTLMDRAEALGKEKRLDNKIERDELSFGVVTLEKLQKQLKRMGIDYSDLK